MKRTITERILNAFGRKSKRQHERTAKRSAASKRGWHSRKHPAAALPVAQERSETAGC